MARGKGGRAYATLGIFAVGCQNRRPPTVKGSMSNSYSKVYLHYVWATKDREPVIAPHWRDRLTQYIRATCERAGGEVLAANTVANHVHLLLWIPLNVPIPTMAKAVKGASSRFVNTELDPMSTFRWQGSYSCHSVSNVMLPIVSRYIQNQQQRHADLDSIFEHGYPQFCSPEEDPT